jgi:hypothetical protein
MKEWTMEYRKEGNKRGSMRNKHKNGERREGTNEDRKR